MTFIEVSTAEKLVRDALLRLNSETAIIPDCSDDEADNLRRKRNLDPRMGT